MIEIIIPGPPVSWKAHGGYGRRSFNPRQKERDYFQKIIRQQYKGDPISYAIGMNVYFYVPIPKSTTNKIKQMMLDGLLRPIKRPDRSNYLKFTEDCLNGLVITDDSIIVQGRAEKWYSDHPETILQIFRVGIEARD